MFFDTLACLYLVIRVHAFSRNTTPPQILFILFQPSLQKTQIDDLLWRREDSEIQKCAESSSPTFVVDVGVDVEQPEKSIF
jgi:hypothetical protein